MNHINHDYRKRLEVIDRKTENRGTVICLASVLFMLGAYFVLANGNANAGIGEIKQLEAQNNGFDCYGTQQYAESSAAPEYLISPDMAAYINLYGKGGDLTECDMQ